MLFLLLDEVTNFLKYEILLCGMSIIILINITLSLNLEFYSFFIFFECVE